MKKILFIILALILASCTPQVTVTSTPTSTPTLPPPTATITPTPTLHPEFVSLQDTIAAAGERFTLMPDGTVSDNGVAIPGLHVDRTGVMTLVVDGKLVTLNPADVSFDDEEGVKIKGYEQDENGEWVPAESEAMQTMQETFAKYNTSTEGYTKVEDGEHLELTDPETGKVIYRDGSFEPLFLGQLIVKNDMCQVTPWTASNVGPTTPAKLREYNKQYGQPLVDTYLLFVKQHIIPSAGLLVDHYYLGGGCWAQAYRNGRIQPSALYFWKDPNGKPLYERVFLTTPR